MTMAPRSACLDYAIVAIAALVACIGGCAKEKTSPLRGKITLDGDPVAAGNIVFLPTGSGRKASAAIEQGAYALASSDALLPGTYRVQISWPKPTGKKIASADPGISADETREAIPAKYNTESTLTVEIASGEVEKDFALSTGTSGA